MFEWIKKMFCKKDTIEDQAMSIWKVHAQLREGRRNFVYKDTRGYLTCGIGHLVLKEDNLKLGYIVSDAKINEWFEKDSEKALCLALKQAKEIGKYNDEFIAALISVNFQLGDWSKVFTSSYPLLVKGDWKKVVANLKRSAWNRQTPVRVSDFIKAIEKEYK